MSTLRSRTLRLFPVLLFAALAAPPAFGLAQRTFVASTGNDANPCSLALPCRGFAAAIAQVMVGGEVIVLDSAGYGPVTITQSVSLIAPAGVYAGVSVLVLPPPAVGPFVGVTINGSGIKVVLQNIAINGLGGNYGILIQQAAQVDVNNCTISNFTLAGLYSIATNTQLNVRDTLVRDNSSPGAFGIWLAAPTRAVLERVHVVRSGSDGIRAEAGADVSVKRGVLAGNGGAGLIASAMAGTTVEATVEDSLIADNSGDGLDATATGSGAVAQLSATQNTITRNTSNGVGVSTSASGASTAILRENMITQQVLNGVFASGINALAAAAHNTFAGNGTSALNAPLPGTIHSVKGADGLASNGGEQATPTIGNVFPTNAF
jgi:hypothetical protein